MRKLLFVVNVDWFFVSHRLPIAQEAMKLGYDVHLASSFSTKKEYLEGLGIKCHDINFSRSGSSLSNEMKTLLSIRRLINEMRPDIVHAVTIKPVIYCGFSMRAMLKPPYFVAAISGLGYVFSARGLKAKLTRFVVSLLYKVALLGKRKVVIFQNLSDQGVLSRIVSLPDNATTLIKGSGADLSTYRYRPEPASGKKVVSMACRLLKEKGVYEFVDAARRVKALLPNIDFWLIGNVDLGNPNSVTQGEIDSWVAEGLIKALGHRDDIPNLFAQSHIVTMPSYYGEGVPKVLIEAAACGRPVVTTYNPGCRDAVIENQTGILVPIRSSKALADAFITLLTNESIRVKMGARARDYAVNEFDVKNVVARHLDIYESI
ncbi:glycosyltransferase family 4 protein [Pseudoalteromonas sp. BDTF-M6]|uniref:glycosyltransferase family 4 protein n=1 Tax=Pseudoalteromonas sp. BDTF-M6 TaxID=2796132 RepID=UPI001BAF92A0|nr:glycosyltransferase family 4 protein [Pseudoalteromonas sp. BDTF-M6]MBS3798476.1 glycosyltransferase family 4 protein [Pseudoalteromonas sp. BDTF-M6]